MEPGLITDRIPRPNNWSVTHLSDEDSRRVLLASRSPCFGDFAVGAYRRLSSPVLLSAAGTAFLTPWIAVPELCYDG